MLTVFLLLIFIYCAYVGYRRGVVYQAILSVGYLVSLAIAALLYKFIIPLITLWVPYPSASPDSKFVFYSSDLGLNLDKPFYASISFIVIFLVIWFIMRLFLHGFTQVKYLNINPSLNHLGAILLSLIVTSISICLVITMISMIPLDFIQKAIDHSILAKSITLYTPIFSSFFKLLFI